MPINIFTSRTKTPDLFSDIRKDLVISPISEDLAVLRNENAVKESIKNLVLTDRGERLMQPFIGGGIRELLFENMTPATIKIIENRVRETIETYEPRCEIISVNVSANLEENSVRVSLQFYVTNIEQATSLDIILERIR
jgi:phage baseplate assembly protein W